MLKQLFLLFIGACMTASFTASAAPASIPATEPTPPEILLKKIADIKIKDLQKLTGKKFTLKEKIGFGILKYKLKQKLKQKPADESKKGETAMIFGIGALLLLALSLFIYPYLIFGSLVAGVFAIIAGGSALKKDPSDKKAKTGKLLGWITVGLIILLIIIAAIAASTMSWEWG